jgi:hypothetical protein
LVADPAEEIRHPLQSIGFSPNHDSEPGSLLLLLLYKDPAPLLSLELTASPLASSSGRTGASRETLNSGYCSKEGGERVYCLGITRLLLGCYIDAGPTPKDFIALLLLFYLCIIWVILLGGFLTSRLLLRNYKVCSDAT